VKYERVAILVVHTEGAGIPSKYVLAGAYLYALHPTYQCSGLPQPTRPHHYISLRHSVGGEVVERGGGGSSWMGQYQIYYKSADISNYHQS